MAAELHPGVVNKEEMWELDDANTTFSFTEPLTADKRIMQGYISRWTAGKDSNGNDTKVLASVKPVSYVPVVTGLYNRINVTSGVIGAQLPIFGVLKMKQAFKFGYPSESPYQSLEECDLIVTEAISNTFVGFLKLHSDDAGNLLAFYVDGVMKSYFQNVMRSIIQAYHQIAHHGDLVTMIVPSNIFLLRSCSGAPQVRFLDVQKLPPHARKSAAGTSMNVQLRDILQAFAPPKTSFLYSEHEHLLGSVADFRRAEILNQPYLLSIQDKYGLPSKKYKELACSKVNRQYVRNQYVASASCFVRRTDAVPNYPTPYDWRVAIDGDSELKEAKDRLLPGTDVPFTTYCSDAYDELRYLRNEAAHSKLDERDVVMKLYVCLGSLYILKIYQFSLKKQPSGLRSLKKQPSGLRRQS